MHRAYQYERTYEYVLFNNSSTRRAVDYCQYQIQIAVAEDPELTRSSGLDVAHLKAATVEQAPLRMMSVVVVVVMVVMASRTPMN